MRNEKKVEGDVGKVAQMEGVFFFLFFFCKLLM